MSTQRCIPLPLRTPTEPVWSRVAVVAVASVVDVAVLLPSCPKHLVVGAVVGAYFVRSDLTGRKRNQSLLIEVVIALLRQPAHRGTGWPVSLVWSCCDAVWWVRGDSDACTVAGVACWRPQTSLLCSGLDILAQRLSGSLSGPKDRRTCWVGHLVSSMEAAADGRKERRSGASLATQNSLFFSASLRFGCLWTMNK